MESGLFGYVHRCAAMFPTNISNILCVSVCFSVYKELDSKSDFNSRLGYKMLAVFGVVRLFARLIPYAEEMSDGVSQKDFLVV